MSIPYPSDYFGPLGVVKCSQCECELSMFEHKAHYIDDEPYCLEHYYMKLEDLKEMEEEE